jgi:hypothetical protein
MCRWQMTSLPQPADWSRIELDRSIAILRSYLQWFELMGAGGRESAAGYLADWFHERKLLRDSEGRCFRPENFCMER